MFIVIWIVGGSVAGVVAWLIPYWYRVWVPLVGSVLCILYAVVTRNWELLVFITSLLWICIGLLNIEGKYLLSKAPLWRWLPRMRLRRLVTSMPLLLLIPVSYTILVIGTSLMLIAFIFGIPETIGAVLGVCVALTWHFLNPAIF